MRHTAHAARPRRLTRAEQREREAAFFNPDLVVNVPAVNLACRLLGLTRLRLAQEMGMDRTHVYRVLAGRLPASPEFRWRLSLALPQAEPAELFTAPGATGPDEDADDDAAGAA